MRSSVIANMYDQISQTFDVSRVRIWKNVQKFLSQQDKRCVLFDAGCGNGKNSLYAMQKNYEVVAIDISEKLVEIASQKGITVYKKDIFDIDYENIFDKCICIAVIHHIDNIEEQCEAILKLIKSLKYGGKLLISVWSYEKENIFDNSEETDEKYRTFELGNNKIKWTVRTNDIIERDYFIHDYKSFCYLMSCVNKKENISYSISWEKQNWFCEITKLNYHIIEVDSFIV